MTSKRNTPKYQEARNTLSEELRPLFDQLVDEYHFHTVAHYGQGYVAYKVLASLVRDGWRPAADPQSETKTQAE